MIECLNETFDEQRRLGVQALGHHLVGVGKPPARIDRHLLGNPSQPPVAHLRGHEPAQPNNEIGQQGPSHHLRPKDRVEVGNNRQVVEPQSRQRVGQHRPPQQRGTIEHSLPHVGRRVSGHGTLAGHDHNPSARAALHQTLQHRALQRLLQRGGAHRDLVIPHVDIGRWGQMPHRTHQWLPERQVEVHRPGAQSRGGAECLVGQQAPATAAGLRRWPGLQVAAHRGAKEVSLIDRLRRTGALEFRGAVGGADQQRQRRQVRLHHRRVVLHRRRTRGAHQHGGPAAGPGDANRLECGAALIEYQVSPERITGVGCLLVEHPLQAKHQRGAARPRAHDHVTDPSASPLIDQRGGKSNRHIRIMRDGPIVG